MKIWEFENKPRNYFVVLIFFLPALLIDLKYLAVGKCIELFKNVFEPYCKFSCAQLIGARVSGGGFD